MQRRPSSGRWGRHDASHDPSSGDASVGLLYSRNRLQSSAMHAQCVVVETVTVTPSPSRPRDGRGGGAWQDRAGGPRPPAQIDGEQHWRGAAHAAARQMEREEATPYSCNS